MARDAPLSDDLSEQLNRWVYQKSFKSIEFHERRLAVEDEFADYNVIYEACFSSSHLAQAALDIFVTSANYIGIGLERRSRVAQRLNIKSIREGYAAGFEPSEHDGHRVLPFLELVCSGKIAIVARMWPIIGLGTTFAVVGNTMGDSVTIGPKRWLKSSAFLERQREKCVLHYVSWD
jgi:hypothetical protein